MATTKRKKKKGRHIFYPIYISLVFIALAGMIFMMRSLWTAMADYEASMPKYVAQEVEKMFTERNFAALYDYDDFPTDGSEGRDDYVKYLNTLTAGQEITSNEVFSINQDEKRYQVKCGGRPLGFFTLCKSGAKSEGGNDLWTLKDAGTNVFEAKTYLFTAPETSSVYADDVLLGSDSIVESGLVLSTAYLPEGLEHEKWCTYSVKRLCSVPQFRVVDSEGREQPFSPDENGRLTVTQLGEDSALHSEMEEYVFKVAKAFARFTSDDVGSSAIMKYVKSDTKASKYIYGFDGGWFSRHRRVDFANMLSENYVRYNENTFACDVRFDYIVTYQKATETYATAYTFFFTKYHDDWMLFDFAVLDTKDGSLAQRTSLDQ